MAPSISSADLVVLGAGPAGLAAAWRAAQVGHSVVVLERAPTVGGMAASFDVAGVRVDHGSHRLHPSTAPELLADLVGLLGEDLQLRRRNGRLRIGTGSGAARCGTDAGAWVGFPLRPAELARRLPRRLLARMALDAATAPVRRRADPPASYADALRRGLGPGLYEALYAPFAEKLWGLSGDEVDAEQARRRVTADTPWKIAARMLRSRGANGGQGKVFHYPRRGFGQLTEAVAQAATDAGARIEVSTEAVSLRPDGHGVSVRTASGEEIDAAQVFSTVPLPVLARITDPGPPAAVLADASALRFRAMVLVYLVVRRPWTPFDAHYLPGAGTPITRVSEPANYRDSADDPPDRTVLCAELPCSPDDEVWTSSDADLAQRVADDLARAGLPVVEPEHVVVRRLRHVYPVYDIGYGDKLAGLDAWAGALRRVTTFGRLGLFAHDNTHHAFTMAYDAVDALSRDGTFNRPAWALARERFTTHVVED